MKNFGVYLALLWNVFYLCSQLQFFYLSTYLFLSYPGTSSKNVTKIIFPQY